ncbi:MAG: sensor histidine kinase [Bacteroidetes bacterium]|nr:sensor histidine kinase [Bacteroidota bacterium]
MGSSPLSVIWLAIAVALLPFDGLISARDTLIESARQRPDSLQVDYLLQAVARHYRSMPEEALRWIDEVERQSFARSMPDARSQAYRFAGAIYKNKGDFARSLEYHLKSLKINDSLNNKAALATNYNDIGIVYKNLGDYRLALEAYQKANALVTELGLKKGIVMTLNNLGTIYEALGQYDDALKYYNRAYAKAKEYDIPEGLSVALSNIGELYANRNEPQTALEYFREAITIDEQTGDLIGSAITRLNIAAMHIGLKQWDSALMHFERAQSIAEQYNSYDLLNKVYSGLTRLYEARGDYRKALEMYRLARNAQDSVYNEAASKQLAEIKARYDDLQKDREIEQLKSEKLFNELTIQQQRSERLALIFLTVFGALIAFMLYRRQQARQAEKHHLELIRQRDAHLSALVEVQENERKELAKELHDGVGQLLSGIKLGLSALKSQVEQHGYNLHNINEITDVVDQTITEVRGISHRMMPRILQEEGLVPAISDMLDKSFKFSNIECVFEHFGLKDRYPEKIEISLYRICQELINNIIKHSGATKVSVQLVQNQNYLILFVEDNGHGLAGDKTDKGIGLLNIATRLKNLHGEFIMEPSPESGLTATVRIPIS